MTEPKFRSGFVIVFTNEGRLTCMGSSSEHSETVSGILIETPCTPRTSICGGGVAWTWNCINIETWAISWHQFVRAQINKKFENDACSSPLIKLSSSADLRFSGKTCIDRRIKPMRTFVYARFCSFVGLPRWSVLAMLFDLITNKFFNQNSFDVYIHLVVPSKYCPPESISKKFWSVISVFEP